MHILHILGLLIPWFITQYYRTGAGMAGVVGHTLSPLTKLQKNRLDGIRSYILGTRPGMVQEIASYLVWINRLQSRWKSVMFAELGWWWEKCNTIIKTTKAADESFSLVNG